MKLNSNCSMLGTAAMALALVTCAPVAGVVSVAQAQTRAGVRLQTRLAGGAIIGVTPSGSARFRSRGRASNFREIDVNTNDGDVVPPAQSGDVVVVADSTGRALLSGVPR
jgi:hypothetical protein